MNDYNQEFTQAWDRTLPRLGVPWPPRPKKAQRARNCARCYARIDGIRNDKGKKNDRRDLRRDTYQSSPLGDCARLSRLNCGICILDTPGVDYAPTTVVCSTLCRRSTYCRDSRRVVPVSNFDDCLSIAFIEPRLQGNIAICRFRYCNHGGLCGPLSKSSRYAEPFVADAGIASCDSVLGCDLRSLFCTLAKRVLGILARR